MASLTLISLSPLKKKKLLFHSARSWTRCCFLNPISLLRTSINPGSGDVKVD
jgi:hypothetical protein